MLFSKGVLRKIFGSNNEELSVDWRRLHNEELHNLCCLTNIIRVTRSRRMRCEGHMARVGVGEKGKA